MTGGKRGRPKTPTTLKVLMGNPGNRPISQDEVKPKPLMPEPLKIVKDEAKEIWDAYAPKLYDLGLLTEVDGIALSALCKVCQRVIQAEEFLDRVSKDKDGNFNGFMFKSAKGNYIQLPQVSIAQTYAKLMALYLGKFGLSPADRVGLNVKPESKPNKSGRVLSG